MEQNVSQINGGITINVDVSIKTSYIWNPAICNCENGKYLRLTTLKLKKINFTVMRPLFFWKT